MATTEPAPKPPPLIKPEPLLACIAAAPHRSSVSKCGRSTEREFTFNDADYAVAHYDRRVRNIPPTALAACPQCVDTRKREAAENQAAHAK